MWKLSPILHQQGEGAFRVRASGSQDLRAIFLFLSFLHWKWEYSGTHRLWHETKLISDPGSAICSHNLGKSIKIWSLCLSFLLAKEMILNSFKFVTWTKLGNICKMLSTVLARSNSASYHSHRPSTCYTHRLVHTDFVHSSH